MHSIIYTKINTHFLYLAEFFLEWWNVSNVQKMKTNFMFKNLFFEKRAVYEIIWKYIVQPGRPKITTWRRRIACWISKTKNINTVHSVLFCIFCFALYILLCSVYFVLFCTFCFVLYILFCSVYSALFCTFCFVLYILFCSVSVYSVFIVAIGILRQPWLVLLAFSGNPYWFYRAFSSVVRVCFIVLFPQL